MDERNSYVELPRVEALNWMEQASVTTVAVNYPLGLYAQSVNWSMVEAQESMLKAILRNGSNAVN